MIDAIGVEAEIRKDYLNQDIETLYFGGGTPSLLPIETLAGLMEKLKATFNLIGLQEITLEANPDDIDAEKLTAWRAMGINRLSIGVQSFEETSLVWMNRAHTAQQSHKAIKLAQSLGWDNISIDLIYGSPTLSNSDWIENVRQAIEYGISHISCYALTVEPKTALEKMIRMQKSAPVDLDLQAHQFEVLCEMLIKNGYEHYEISNFSLPNQYSRHNSSYWSGAHYLGLGPSAHSYNGISRQWNVANNPVYLKAIGNGEIPFEIELLTEQQKHNEYIMTSLRTNKGIDLGEIKKLWGERALDGVQKNVLKYVENGLVTVDLDRVVLTQQGKWMADGIAAGLFV